MKPSPSSSRLDTLLAARALVRSRSQARDMIRRGCVKVAGRVERKAGVAVASDVHIEIMDPARNYVSRAALKLLAALDETGFDVCGKMALDLGASTGGFTQVLLERGAEHVAAVDVGHGQIAPDIASNPRVTVIEGVNARHLGVEQIGFAPQIIVSDMSFVSLRIAAEPALLFAAEEARCALLVKPQFEVGRTGVGKGGLVTDNALIQSTLQDLAAWLDNLPGWKVTHLLPSPIEGGEGNREYLLCGQRHD